MAATNNNKWDSLASDDTGFEGTTVSLARLRAYTPIYPALLAHLDPSKIGFGIWLQGSHDIIEFIGSSMKPEIKQFRINELLGVISRLQSVAKVLVLKPDRNAFYDNLTEHRCQRLKKFSFQGREKELAEIYLAFCDATGKIMSKPDNYAYIRAAKMAQNIVRKMKSASGIPAMLFRIAEEDVQFLDHVPFVSMFAVAMGYELRLPPNAIELVLLGSMFIDIGLGELDLPDVYTRKLSSKDLVRYERHPTSSVDLLNEITAMGCTIPEEVFKIVLQHHEAHNGSGYPNGLTGRLSADNPDGIHVLAAIVGLCSKFSSMFQKVEGKPTFKPNHAIRSINRLSGDHDPIVLKFFNKLVCHSPTTELKVTEKIKWIIED